MANAERDNAAAYGKVVAKAWRDPSFKAQLIADPQTTLAAAGVRIPAGVAVKVVEDTATHVHLVLPTKPTGALSEEALDRVAGGWGPCWSQVITF